jgi:hypothetical protein
MADFTIDKYTLLLQALMEQAYDFQTYTEFLSAPKPRSIILRHDVDKRPANSLTLAQIESKLGLKGVYYFRAKACSWDEKTIKEIAKLGHEVGYHYEDLSTQKGDHKQAYEAFQQNLEKLRKLVPVSTICMHGSPTSRHDSRDLWKHYKYKDLQLSGEPYFDTDFSQVLYLTDTGRRWDGHKVSIRDKVDPKQMQLLTDKGFHLHSTQDIIRAAKKAALPDHLMLTIHPQRWHSNKALWLKELIMQNLKNTVKGALVILKLK